MKKGAKRGSGSRSLRPKGTPRYGRRSDAAPLTPWDQAARWYDTLVGLKGSEYQRNIVMPGAFRLLALKPGDRVLDLACGQGVFARFLHTKKMKVVGLDSSHDLIQFARKRSNRAIRFEVGDAQSPGTLKGETFDAVVCLLAIQNIEDLDATLRNVRRWLKPEGRFVMVMTHPCFRIPRQTHWGWDEDRKIQFRRVDLYASETAIPILTPPMATSEVYTVTYHRSLQRYLEGLSKAGLVVDALEEWASDKTSAPGPRARAENRARQEIPLFLALRAVPRSGISGARK